MLRRIIVAFIGLLAVVNGSKWLFDGKRLPTFGLGPTRFSKSQYSETSDTFTLYLRSSLRKIICQ